MSWELASILVLVVAAVVAVVWFERRRPSSKEIALIGTMAALAVVGRILFAPVPNVKPTTDLIVLTGLVFGGAPGAATGAVAAFASNFFFGQGPWTPWQMLAWGLTGLIGAVAARLFGRNPERLTFALVCAASGLIFGLVMNAQTWLVFTGEHSWASFVRISALSLWFDLAHALGNFIFGLLAGPALLTMLNRYRGRFQLKRVPLAKAGATTFLLLIVAAFSAVPLALAGDTNSKPIERAVQYLKSAQNSDGGFGGKKGDGSSALYTSWVVLGLEAAATDPSSVAKDGKNPIDYLRSKSTSTTDLGELERTVMVLEAANIDSRSFEGRNLVKEIQSKQKTDGSFGGQVNFTAFAIFALRSAGVRVGSKTVTHARQWLAQSQLKDGGFSFARKGTSSVDMTGAVLEALASAGMKTGKTVQRAVTYLDNAVNANDGFGQFEGDTANGQSTAWAVQGLAAVGENVTATNQFLSSLQQDDGSFRYSRTSSQTPVWVTAQAIPALAKKPFPLKPVAVEKKKLRGKLSLPEALVVATATSAFFVAMHRRRAKRLHNKSQAT